MAIFDSNIVMLAFSEDQAEQLTGVSKRQLSYWDGTGFFIPEHAVRNRKSSFSRIYSFKDIVALRVLNKLRNEERVPLQHLREVAEILSQMPDQSWIKTKIFIHNKKVVFAEPGTDKYIEAVSGQYVLKFDLKVTIEDTERRIRAFNERDSSSIGKIEKNRNINHNNWVISQTRIPVKAIKSFRDAGFSVDQILDEYPSLAKQDVIAALKHDEKRKVA